MSSCKVPSNHTMHTRFYSYLSISVAVHLQYPCLSFFLDIWQFRSCNSWPDACYLTKYPQIILCIPIFIHICLYQLKFSCSTLVYHISLHSLKLQYSCSTLFCRFSVVHLPVVVTLSIVFSNIASCRKSILSVPSLSIVFVSIYI